MLKFMFGASGAGKSTGLYQEIIDRSFGEKDTDFLIIVPDQFTMQTQLDVVKMHPSHAIMNIDVLSFGRLSHRIFEEVGLSSFSVLDDVGKSLILRRVSDILGDELKVIGKNMHKPGYLDEVKSTISEFMMYGIGDEELAILEEKSASKGALNSKIKDLRLLYREFKKYIEGKYITTEETLDILCRSIPMSSLIKKSVIVFDGFTGFTPIQYRVIRQLLDTSKEVIVSVTIDPKEDPYAPSFEEQELFMLSKKTVLDLEKLEYMRHCDIIRQNGSAPSFDAFRLLRRQENKDILINEKPVRRLKENKELSFLEENLFRYNANAFSGDVNKINIYEASTPLQEIRQTLIKITDLVRNEGYAYRDIAVVCGSLDSYAELISNMAGKFDIPIYIDKNVSLMLNPFIEYIQSAINIAISNYKYEDVFHYMRSGMTDYSREDTDLLENYVRALGISGKKQWDDKFLRHMPKHFKSRKKDAEDNQQEIELMNRLEEMRIAISTQLEPLFQVKKGTAKEITDAIISIIEANNSEGKLDSYREMFREKGDIKKSKEYEQIYGKIMSLLEQISRIIGDDELTLEEYRDILAAGFGEIEVGTIPQDVDRIIIGDIERTRLKEVRVLFLIGACDGAIPANTGSGGILSDIDRQYLLDLDTGVELAPTPRQQMYIQRLYLYMNLTKPKDRLFLSYSEMDNDGKSLRPAYLVPKLLRMFPSLQVERPEDGDFESQNVSLKDSLSNASDLLRRFAGGIIEDEDKKNLLALTAVLKESDAKLVDRLTDAAFTHYESKPLAKAVALSLYGASLENSVSRLETFARCCFAHFLKYGLHLEERKDYDFDYADLGNVFHGVLEKYTSEIMTRGIDWRNLSKEESEEILNHALTEVADSYGDTILRSSARYQYMVERIHRILSRTVDTLKYQISKGRFNPAFVEMNFSEAGNIDDINITLTEDEEKRVLEKMKLHGRIDRVDLYEDESSVYVKVIDFKSSEKKLSIASIYYGLQLQLVMYMNVATAVEKKLSGGKEAVPSAILYYHVDDPVVEGKNDIQPDDINQAIKEELKMTGLVSENMDVIQYLDEGLTAKSDVIPVELKKDGSIGSRSQTIADDDYKAVKGYVNDKIREFGKRILNGDIEINPYCRDSKKPCTFCSFKSICGYDEKIPGFNTRDLDMKDDEAMEAIRQEQNKEN